MVFFTILRKFCGLLGFMFCTFFSSWSCSLPRCLFIYSLNFLTSSSKISGSNRTFHSECKNQTGLFCYGTSVHPSLSSALKAKHVTQRRHTWPIQIIHLVKSALLSKDCSPGSAAVRDDLRDDKCCCPLLCLSQINSLDLIWWFHRVLTGAKCHWQ